MCTVELAWTRVRRGRRSDPKAEPADPRRTNPVAEVLPHLRAAKGPVVLAGDFNQTPDSEPLLRLREAGLSDAWSTLHPDAPGFSFHENGALSRRIDHVLLDIVAAQRLRAAWLVLDEPGMRRASDHTALLVDLDDPD